MNTEGMTLAQDVGRFRRKGGDVRDRPPDKLPQPRAVAAEVRELKVRLSVFVAVYDIEHDALASLASSDVHVQTGPSDTTVSSLMDGENAAARQRCRVAAAYLHAASANIKAALAVFGPDAVQLTRSPDSVVSESTFESAINRARHRQREKGLRHG